MSPWKLEMEKVVIIGPSGSGKSTLIRCSNGLEKPASGKIVVDGMRPAPSQICFASVTTTSPWYFKTSISIPHKTLAKMKTLAPIKSLKDRGIKRWRQRAVALERVGLSKQADTCPPALRRSLGNVAIARALEREPQKSFCSMSPPLLDPRNDCEVADVIAGLARAIINPELCDA